MRYVADENIDAAIVVALRDSGHEVWYVAEEARGITDTDVLRRASADGAVLLSSDKDFGDLVYRQRRASAGVLLVRLAGTSPAMKARLVTQAVQEHSAELVGAFSVLTKSSLRIRRDAPPS